MSTNEWTDERKEGSEEGREGGREARTQHAIIRNQHKSFKLPQKAKCTLWMRSSANKLDKEEEWERMRENESEDRKQPQKETRQANLQLKCLSQDKFCAYAKVGQDTGKGHKDSSLGLCRAGLERHYAYAALSTILSPIYVWVCVPQLTNAPTARECEHKARPRPMGPRPKAKPSLSRRMSM